MLCYKYTFLISILNLTHYIKGHVLTHYVNSNLEAVYIAN